MSHSVYFVTLPGKPTIDSIDEGDTQLTVNWTASDDGDAPITGYRVKRQDYDEYTDYETLPPPTSTVVEYDVAEDVTDYTITGLTNGKEYVIWVIAKNESFDLYGGTSSSEAYGTPMGLPGAPRNLSVTEGNEKLTLTWEAPTPQDGVTVNGYRVQWKADTVTDWDAQTGVTEVSVGANVLTHTVNSLTNGTTYDVRVRANNDITSDSYAWATGDGTPRPDPIVTGVTVADATITQTAATATVAIDNQTDEGQTVHLQYRKNTESGWTVETPKSVAATATSVDFPLSNLDGNTTYVVQAWLAATTGTKESVEFTTDPVNLTLLQTSWSRARQTSRSP